MSDLFHRKAKNQLLDFINEKSKKSLVGILSGPRQVGKSTLVKEIIRDQAHLFLDLERSKSTAAAMDKTESFEDFEAYLANQHGWKNQKILVIDEAQESTRLGSWVRFMKEEWPDRKVILTGSVISELHLQSKRRPVGRELFFDLWPLSFYEFLAASGKDSLVKTMDNFELGQSLSPLMHESFLKSFEDYLQVGGLPEVIDWYLAGKDYQKLRADLYRTYEDDFIRYFSLEEVNLFRRAMEATASNVGSPSKDTQVVPLDGPGYKKVAGIFARLEKWKLIIKCEQLAFSPEKNYFYPKRYLYDLGILSDLRFQAIPQINLQKTSPNLLRTPLGGLIENALALSLKIQFGDSLAGLRLSPQSEIDFVIKNQKRLIPMECKVSNRFKKNYLTTLKNYLKKTQSDLAFLFYGGPPLKESIQGIWALPYYFSDCVKGLVSASLV